MYIEKDYKTTAKIADFNKVTDNLLEHLKDMYAAVQTLMEEKKDISLKIPEEQGVVLALLLFDQIFQLTAARAKTINRSALLNDIATRQKLFVSSGYNFDEYLKRKTNNKNKQGGF